MQGHENCISDRSPLIYMLDGEQLNVVSYQKDLGVMVDHQFKLQRLYSFSNWVINDWIILPAHVVNAHSLSCFKNLLDKHWTDSQYDCIDKCMFCEQVVLLSCKFNTIILALLASYSPWT